MTAGCATPVIVTEKFTVEQGKSLNLVAQPSSAYVMKVGIDLGKLSGLPKDVPKAKGPMSGWLVLGAERQVEVVVVPTNIVSVGGGKHWWQRKK
jgi:hypothetical protein